tara:strand:+ start:396 stop:560 length:165 start_codon:yes stop_codon:yes gene_type:complete
MSINFNDYKTEARIAKAIKALSKTQVKEITKKDFSIDAINYYIDHLIKKKIIKM